MARARDRFTPGISSPRTAGSPGPVPPRPGTTVPPGAFPAAGDHTPAGPPSRRPRPRPPRAASVWKETLAWPTPTASRICPTVCSPCVSIKTLRPRISPENPQPSPTPARSPPRSRPSPYTPAPTLPPATPPQGSRTRAPARTPARTRSRKVAPPRRLPRARARARARPGKVAPPRSCPRANRERWPNREDTPRTRARARARARPGNAALPRRLPPPHLPGGPRHGGPARPSTHGDAPRGEEASHRRYTRSRQTMRE